MRINLVRLYSENDRFRPVTFKPGINLICGQNSRGEDGSVKSKKQNGVGKSLTIDLINFCLFKTNDSRVQRISDVFLPEEDFVYLHFSINATNYVIGRNRAGDVRIKTSDAGEFIDYTLTDGKRYIENLLGFNRQPISLREYLNFFIKEENYNYAHFAELFRGAYPDILKIHFYLFALPVELLSDVKSAYSEYDEARKKINKVNSELKTEGIKIEKLRAKKNALEAQVDNLEGKFEYDKILSTMQERSSEINEAEQKIQSLIMEKKNLEYQLRELNDFTAQFEDDFYIDDKDVSLVFERYSKGLGDLVRQNVNDIRKFRDQLNAYRHDLVIEKAELIEKSIDRLKAQIASRREVVDTFYKDIANSKKNHIIKSFRIYRDELNEFRNYENLLALNDEGELESNNAKTNFASAMAELANAVEGRKALKDSFQKSFLKIHEYVTSSVEASFDFTTDVRFSPSNRTNFFRFKVATETTGSRGSNQMTAAIYDAAIHENEYTVDHTLGLLIHDNLIFGMIEKDSSIKYLNYIHETFVKDNGLQYIATVNMDDFDYDELKKDFSFDIKEDVVIELTREKPLFKKMTSSLIQ